MGKPPLHRFAEDKPTPQRHRGQWCSPVSQTSWAPSPFLLLPLVLGSKTGRLGWGVGRDIPNLCGSFHSITLGPFRTSALRTLLSPGQDGAPGRLNSTPSPRIHGPRTRPLTGLSGQRSAALSQSRLPLGRVGCGLGSRQPAVSATKTCVPCVTRARSSDWAVPQKLCQGTRGRAGRARCQHRGLQGWRLQGVPRLPVTWDSTWAWAWARTWRRARRREQKRRLMRSHCLAGVLSLRVSGPPHRPSRPQRHARSR